MRKILLLPILAALLSCGGKQENATTAAAIDSNNLEQMKQRRSALQTELSLIEDAIEKLDTTTEQALVSVMALKDTTFTHYVEVQGSVDTKQNLIIYPEFAGTITSLNAKAGQRVSRGQVLGRIDDGGLSQQAAQLEAQLALAKTTYERQKRLWDQKIGSEIQFLQAQTAMQSQQKAVAQIRAQISKTVITAPFSGVIDQVMAERGQVVAPGQGLMRIVNLGDMYVSASIPENYIGKVKVGSPVLVAMPSMGREITGKIRQVGNFIDPANRTFGVEVTLPNPDNVLRPNQVAKLRIVDYVRKNAIAVPSNIIQEDASGDKFVYVASNVSGNSAEARKVMVKTGETSGNETEITSGLSAGDKVVVEGATSVSEGMKLNF